MMETDFIDDETYDFLVTFRCSNGEYESANLRAFDEFKQWIGQNVKFTKQELVDMMSQTAKEGNNG